MLETKYSCIFGQYHAADVLALGSHKGITSQDIDSDM